MTSMAGVVASLNKLMTGVLASLMTSMAGVLGLLLTSVVSSYSSEQAGPLGLLPVLFVLALVYQ